MPLEVSLEQVKEEEKVVSLLFKDRRSRSATRTLIDWLRTPRLEMKDSMRFALFSE